MILFDTLNRRMLPPYGCDWTHAPNFARLAGRSVTFDNCYGGSMPCMPARRELHTGRYNFLHRSWGPLEPFDDSVPEILRDHGVYTHLVTDHQHYWEDGGATYHNRYSSYEFFRGQEGDRWKGHVADPEIPEVVRELRHGLWRQDWVNRRYLADEADHPQTRTFDAGLEFLAANRGNDNWFLHIETFDPHEPYFSYDRHRRHYTHDYPDPHFDWPEYKKVTETSEQVHHVRSEYGALLTMCDESLGRVLDFLDEHRLWGDTMLIVCTDHGFLLGEHGWLGKNLQPWYDETIHTPLFIWDPRSAQQGTRRSSLVQTIDIGPTLLDYFGIAPTADMQGAPLADTVAADTLVRDAALFGIFGGHVCVTDGRYVYMRACGNATNEPLFEHTLMPTRMSSRFPVSTLAKATLAPPFTFTKGAPVLRMPGDSLINPWWFGSLLFDLRTDPEQERPLLDDELERRLATLLRDLLVASDAPPEQFERLGLPQDGAIGDEHLLVRVQWPQLLVSMTPPPTADQFPQGRLTVTTPLQQLLIDPAAREVLQRHTPSLVDTPLAGYAASLSPLQIAARSVDLLSHTVLHELADELALLD